MPMTSADGASARAALSLSTTTAARSRSSPASNDRPRRSGSPSVSKKAAPTGTRLIATAGPSSTRTRTARGAAASAQHARGDRHAGDAGNRADARGDGLDVAGRHAHRHDVVRRKRRLHGLERVEEGEQHRGEDDQPGRGSELGEDHGIAGAVAGDLARGGTRGRRSTTPPRRCATGAAPGARRRPAPRRRSRRARSGRSRTINRNARGERRDRPRQSPRRGRAAARSRGRTRALRPPARAGRVRRGAAAPRARASRPGRGARSTPVRARCRARAACTRHSRRRAAARRSPGPSVSPYAPAARYRVSSWMGMARKCPRARRDLHRGELVAGGRPADAGTEPREHRDDRRRVASTARPSGIHRSAPMPTNR